MSVPLNRSEFLAADALAFRRIEDAYVAMRHRGYTADAAAGELGITDSAKRSFEGHIRAQAGETNDARDPTVPSFALHDEHIAAVMAEAGGFPKGTGAIWVRPDGQRWGTA